MREKPPFPKGGFSDFNAADASINEGTPRSAGLDFRLPGDQTPHAVWAAAYRPKIARTNGTRAANIPPPIPSTVPTSPRHVGTTTVTTRNITIHFCHCFVV
jgi:hypothetical protein